MFALGNDKKAPEAHNEQNWTQRLARIAQPAAACVWNMVVAPVELAQRMFYRPNARHDELVVEDLHAKCKESITKSYIDVCTQKLYTKPVDGKFDPRSTYENLQACQSGTFKIPGMETEIEPPVPQLVLLDEIVPAQLPGNVALLPSPSLSDSQILKVRPGLTDSQVMLARPGLSDSQIMTARRSLVVRPLLGELAGDNHTGTESGTYASLQHLNQTKASVIQCGFTQSGVYQLIEPDINPNGLQHFIESEEQEKTA